MAHQQPQDLYDRRLAHPVHWFPLKSNAVVCGQAKPGEGRSRKMKNVSCLKCREIIMADSKNFRYVWGQ